ncbi:MAG: TauD/TfdA family dioxygenase [Ectothiorhodospiraceae bacterium]|nr:TauD/TfdA family dioxygenase [Chromatiales bacterium]MCP5154218.1 TauD/TfdA family dioxygenase [Ectothiorhodospiraceae bacterium]
MSPRRPEMTISIRRLNGALGAEVGGVDLARPLDAATADAIRAAFVGHAVLVFRGQDLDPAAQVAFTRLLGTPERHVLQQFALPEAPDVFVISNVKEKGQPKGAIRAGQYWHSDLSYTARPTSASLLHAIRIPSYGGDTMFAGMAAAFDALSPTMQGMLDGLRAVHDYTLAYETFFSRFADRPPLTAEQKAAVPPVEHPLVRTHPESGRRALFVNPGFTRRIVGLAPEESRALLDFLFAHATRPDLVYRHVWRAGDLVMWDNRSTMHLAVADYDMDEPRHMHRTSVQGDVPR